LGFARSAMQVENRGIAAIRALNPDPLVDAADPDETRLIDSTGGGTTSLRQQRRHGGHQPQGAAPRDQRTAADRDRECGFAFFQAVDHKPSPAQSFPRSMLGV